MRSPIINSVTVANSGTGIAQNTWFVIKGKHLVPSSTRPLLMLPFVQIGGVAARVGLPIFDSNSEPSVELTT